MELHYVSRHRNDMPTFYANAVSGNWSPRGDLVLHFAIEYSEPSAEEHVIIDERGAHSRDPRTEEVVPMVRDYQCRLVLPWTQLESIVQWLQERVNESRTMQPRPLRAAADEH